MVAPEPLLHSPDHLLTSLTSCWNLLWKRFMAGDFWTVNAKKPTTTGSGLKRMKRMNRSRSLRFNRGDLYEIFVCLLLAGLFVLLSSGAAFAQGNVGINNPTPHTKSLLDLTSTDKGLLTPRMTAAQRTAMFPAPDATGRGMLVYQTDGGQGFYYYDGAAWQMLQAGGAGWGLLGNAGTNPATNFLGTTDNQGIALRTNNTERLRIEGGGNVGIGTSTPFRLLELASSTQAVQRMTSNNAASGSVLEFNNNTVGAGNLGALNFLAGGVTTGQLMYSTINGMTMAVNGAERMRIASNGQVGIGTTAPAAPLHVMHAQAGASSMLVQNTSAAGWSGINFLGNTGAGNSTVGYDNSTQNGYFGTTTAHPVTFITSWAERMRIAANGNVGIGTNVTNVRFQVAADQPMVLSNFYNANASGYGGIHFDNNSGGRAHVGFAGSTAPSHPGLGYTGTVSNHPFVLTTADQERMRIDANGNVGIGTATPTRLLEVSSPNQGVQRLSSANSANGSVLEMRNTTAGNNNLGAINFLDGLGTRGQLAYHLTDGMILTTAGAERMRIDPLGNVGIGTAAPGRRLHVVDPGIGVVSAFQGTNAAGYSISHWLRSDNVGAHVGFFNPGVGGALAGNFVTGTFGNAPVSITTNNAERIRIATDGKVGIGTAAPASELEVNGFTKLGSNAPAVRMLKLTGTTAGTIGGYVDIAHGLTTSKILSVQVLIESASGTWIPTSYTSIPGYLANFLLTGSVVRVVNMSGDSGGILGKPMKILITYEA